MKVYIDGELDPQTAPAPARIRRVPVPLYFAEYGSGVGARRFDGMLDEVRLIKDVAAVSVPTRPYAKTEPNTVALWHFDSIGSDGFPNVAGDSALNIQLDGSTAEAQAEGAPGFGGAYEAALP